MPNHYNYTFDEVTVTYNFTTKKNVLYRIAFIVDETLEVISDSKDPIAYIYQIVIEKVSGHIEPFDSLVANTVEQIVIAFFQNTENSLIYVCSDDDSKSNLRYTVFDRWYRRSTYKEYIIKIDNAVSIRFKGEITTLYTSLLYHRNNPNIDGALAAYQKLEEVLNADK